MRTRRVELGDVSLHVVDAGEGGRPVMLVHGFTANSDEVAGVIEPLTDLGWHAVAPDLRGHGRSDRPTDAGAYSLELMAADVVALADWLGWDRFALLGHSMGGGVAQLIALDHPERLSGLILASTFHGPVPGISMELVQLGCWVVREAGMEGLADAQAARRAENPESVAAFERLQEAIPGYAEQSRARLVSTSPDMWMAMAPRFVDQEDRLSRLAALDVPTAVIVGEFDGTMGDDCRRLAAAIPGASLTVIAGAGHVPQLEQPEAWWAALSEFMSRL
jgi:3-oxoadipate enol-lactonase